MVRREDGETAMAGKHLMKSGALAALAAGLAFAAAPSIANAQDEHGRRGGWQQNGGGEGRGNAGNWQGRGNGGGNGGGWQGRQAERQAQPEAQPRAQPPAQVQVQQAPRMERQGGFWGQRGDGGQRQPQAQPQRQERQGGSWGQRGDGSQRQPQGGFWGQRERTNQAPQAIERSYVDPNRNGAYTPRDGQRWQGQNWDRNRETRTWDRDRRWDGNRAGGWNRDWRRDNRFGWQTYRNQHRDVFRMGRYYSPYNNWSYRRLGIGVTLQPLFFSQNYWIDDPWMYRLPEADGPYRWVRYYDDALLVDIYSGEVVDVIYDFFW